MDFSITINIYDSSYFHTIMYRSTSLPPPVYRHMHLHVYVTIVFVSIPNPLFFVVMIILFFSILTNSLTSSSSFPINVSKCARRFARDNSCLNMYTACSRLCLCREAPAPGEGGTGGSTEAQVGFRSFSGQTPPAHRRARNSSWDEHKRRSRFSRERVNCMPHHYLDLPSCHT